MLLKTTIVPSIWVDQSDHGFQVLCLMDLEFDGWVLRRILKIVGWCAFDGFVEMCMAYKYTILAVLN